MLDKKVFYNANDIACVLSVSKSTAYRIIKKMNAELKNNGYIVVSGRVPKKYFDEKFYC